MTFNTTTLPLEQAVAAGHLVVRAPLRPLAEAKRALFVTPAIGDLLDGRTQFGMFPQHSTEVLIGRFVAGQLVTVSRKFTKNKPDVEQIVGYDEVWALCPRTPRPGWRILGRFIDQGHFVALRAWDKRHLFGNYGKAASEVIEDWRGLFGDHPPFTAATADEYLGGVVRDADQKS